MDRPGPVRDAYSHLSEQYIGLFDGADGWQGHEGDTALVRRHLTGFPGPVLDLGCGPGHGSAYLHSLDVDVTGVDVVPEFIAHARATHPGPAFRLGSMTEADVPEHSVSGILSWYSTIHLPPAELDRTLAEFDHAVITAYRRRRRVRGAHRGPTTARSRCPPHVLCVTDALGGSAGEPHRGRLGAASRTYRRPDPRPLDGPAWPRRARPTGARRGR